MSHTMGRLPFNFYFFCTVVSERDVGEYIAGFVCLDIMTTGCKGHWNNFIPDANIPRMHLFMTDFSVTL